MMETNEDPNKAIIQVPVEMIFTEDYQTTGGAVDNWTQEWFRHNRRWSNLPIGRLWPHHQLYQFFRGSHSDDAAAYLAWYRNIFELRGMKSPRAEPDVLEGRFRLFQKWNRVLWSGGPGDPEFILDASFDAERGVFMLKDGHHRSAFLRGAGIRYLLLRVTREESETWLNPDEAQHVRDVLAAQSRAEFYTPIQHPDFYAIDALREASYRSRLDHIFEYLGPYRFRGRLLDIGSNTGYFSHQFAREGVEVVGFEPDRNHFDLANALSRLYRSSARFENKPFEDANPNEHFSGSFLLTVLYHLLAQDKHRPLLERLDQMVEDFVIWESGSNPEVEKEVVRRFTRFANYRKIADTYGTGRARELGIFFTEDFGKSFDAAHAEFSVARPGDQKLNLSTEKQRRWFGWLR
ncbi:DUF1698 domain-containing protein [Caballeronia sp. INDeC2]|uniref:class I SAM-dependent methyltransferase n=1 Tax=Caballeronia sp. INDeC2 TaxID=2921747 RepID=UPI002027C48B|nr:DUF1698 domain-containing protein [Caballeronia sp. INDeC2]